MRDETAQSRVSHVTDVFMRSFGCGALTTTQPNTSLVRFAKGACNTWLFHPLCWTQQHMRSTLARCQSRAAAAAAAAGGATTCRIARRTLRYQGPVHTTVQLDARYRASIGGELRAVRTLYFVLSIALSAFGLTGGDSAQLLSHATVGSVGVACLPARTAAPPRCGRGRFAGCSRADDCGARHTGIQIQIQIQNMLVTTRDQ
jgi:hypothetical protein